jgi:hypothetical protein
MADDDLPEMGAALEIAVCVGCLVEREYPSAVGVRLRPRIFASKLFFAEFQPHTANAAMRSTGRAFLYTQTGIPLRGSQLDEPTSNPRPFALNGLNGRE